MQTSPGMNTDTIYSMTEEIIKIISKIAVKLEISKQNQQQWKTFSSNLKSLAINLF